MLGGGGMLGLGLGGEVRMPTCGGCIRTKCKH